MNSLKKMQCTGLVKLSLDAKNDTYIMSEGLAAHYMSPICSIFMKIKAYLYWYV